MENIFKLLRMAFSMIVFFIAIMLLHRMNQQFDALIDKSADEVIGDNLMYEAVPSDLVHYTTKAELIAFLMDEIEYNIEVFDEFETYSISSKEYSPSNLEMYSFSNTYYVKSYNYHLNGEISKIVFRYVAG